MSTHTHDAPHASRSLFSRRTSLSLTLAVAFLSVLATFLITRNIYSPRAGSQNSPIIPHDDNSEYRIRRDTSFKFIRPLVSAKPVTEFGGYQGIKRSAEEVIQYFKSQGAVSSVSVYMRDFDKSNWISVNPNEKYSPASLLKIPVMMAVLKYGEEHPGFLDEVQQFVYKFRYGVQRRQSIVSKQIEFGKRYSRRELLRYMIEYSDNNAMSMLWMSMDKNLYASMFEVLGIARPDVKKDASPLTCVECSCFMESLFNATYLGATQSECAINLLSRSTFSEGIVKGVPEGIARIAHKFGESGSEKFKEMHETAILYIDKDPYLVTIMTRGQENVGYDKLETVIQGVARTIYLGIKAKEKSSPTTVG